MLAGPCTNSCCVILAYLFWKPHSGEASPCNTLQSVDAYALDTRKGVTTTDLAHSSCFINQNGVDIALKCVYGVYMLRINITTTPRILALLDAEAKALELNRSELLRRILDARYDDDKTIARDTYD